MEELDLKELFDLFWRKKITIILIVAIFILIGIIYTVGFTTPMYSSSTTLILVSSGNEGQNQDGAITATDITVNSKLVSTYSELVTSKTIRRKVISNLGIDLDEEKLKKNIKVSSVKDTEVIEITVSDENPVRSMQIANEIAKVFTEEVKNYYKIDNVQIVDEAEVDNEPSNINHEKDVIIFAFIGLVVSVCYILVANMLDTTVKTAEDIEKMFKVPVLASIPVYVYETDMQNAKKGKGGKR